MSNMPAGRSESVDAGGVVHRLVAPNPGPKTLQGTNSYVVGQQQVYIIDPGPNDERHLASIADWLDATGGTALGILLTHGHQDHALGAAALSRALGIPIWAADPEPYPLYVAPDHVRLPAYTELRVGSDILRTIPTPGHTPDSVSYFLEGMDLVFTGDTILGQGSTIIAPPEGDMTSYMASLDLLRSLRAMRLAPGHGPFVADAEAKIDEYIEHRRSRESQLVSALAAGPSTVPTLVARLYIDTPSELRQLAEGSVAAGLQKLQLEGLVQRHGDSWSLVIVEPQ
jgi:glyoxylase-like metal-dependent hydrolase (beta-lactamase superfamily II)